MRSFGFAYSFPAPSQLVLAYKVAGSQIQLHDSQLARGHFTRPGDQRSSSAYERVKCSRTIFILPLKLLEESCLQIDVE